MAQDSGRVTNREDEEVELMDYLVVLKESRNTVILLTAYCTDRDHTRNKLRSERKIGLK